MPPSSVIVPLSQPVMCPGDGFLASLVTWPCPDAIWEHTFYLDSGEAGGNRMPTRGPGTGHCPQLVMGWSLTLHRKQRNFLCSREQVISWSIFLVTSGMRCFSKSNIRVLMKGQCRAMQLLPALVSWRKFRELVNSWFSSPECSIIWGRGYPVWGPCAASGT